MKKSQQRLKTHRALMVGAIKLMSDDRSFSSISLREVTREAGRAGRILLSANGKPRRGSTGAQANGTPAGL